MIIERATIGDYCEAGDGAHASIKRYDEGVLYLMSRNIKEGILDLSKVAYINQASFMKYFKTESKAISRPRENDVIFGIIGSIGDAYIVKKSDVFGLASSVAILRPNLEKLHPKYLYYWIRGQYFQNALYSIKGGVAQSYVSLEMIRSLPLHLPPVPIQKRIAGVLSAYDDLIEVNMRRIKALDEMASRTYEEWFVNYRFPGGDGTRPKDWLLKTTYDVFEIMGGGTPSKKIEKYWIDGVINWYSPSDLTKSGLTFASRSGSQITELGLKKSSAKIFPPNSIMLTSRATIGVVAINTTEACTNQGFITCRPNQNCPTFFLYHWVKYNVPTFIRHASGATFKEISKTVFKGLPFDAPRPEIVELFEQFSSPLMKTFQNLETQNTNLRAQRDLLLPRLISGEIDVSEAPLAKVAE